MTTTSSLPVTKHRSTVGRAVENRITRMLGLTAATTDFTVTRNVRVPTRDGVELAADL